jgi:hypothetical protein
MRRRGCGPAGLSGGLREVFFAFVTGAYLHGLPNPKGRGFRANAPDGLERDPAGSTGEFSRFRHGAFRRVATLLGWRFPGDARDGWTRLYSWLDTDDRGSRYLQALSGAAPVRAGEYFSRLDPGLLRMPFQTYTIYSAACLFGVTVDHACDGGRDYALEEILFGRHGDAATASEKTVAGQPDRPRGRQGPRPARGRHPQADAG